MKSLAPLLAPVIGVTLLWSPLATAQQTPAPPAAAAVAPDVDPQVVQALRRMGAYLGSMPTFAILADTTIDDVMNNGQKVQMGGQVLYHVRRPNGLAIELVTDRKVRQFYYDGKSLTVFAPRLGLYATVPAPATIAGTLALAYDKYDIVLPLADLFTWSDANIGRADALRSATYVGYARINGVDTDQYAMREDGVDWQVWIRRGDKPLPVKVAIVSVTDPTQPQYTTNLTWEENPKYTDATFKFDEPKGAHRIEIVEVEN